MFFGPAPWGPGEGPKGQISLNIIKFQLQSQFQRFFNQTLCVFSHMKDIKHIRQDFHLVAWVMPQGLDLGVPWGVWGSKFFFSKFNQIWCVSYLHEWHMHRRHFLGPHPLGPWGGAKRSSIIKSELQSPPSVCPSVRPSRYLLLNHWMKSNQIWCVSCSHE